MDITIRENYCMNESCIGVKETTFGKSPLPLIVIESSWNEPQKIIEKAIAGLISHETIEYLLLRLFPQYISDLHDLIGRGQDVVDYVDNLDGIVIVNKGE